MNEDNAFLDMTGLECCPDNGTPMRVIYEFMP